MTVPVVDCTFSGSKAVEAFEVIKVYSLEEGDISVNSATFLLIDGSIDGYSISPSDRERLVLVDCAIFSCA